jgi:hypothetical protein
MLEEISESLPAIVRIKGPQICLQCRFTRLLCGKPKCPILIKLNSFVNTSKIISSNIETDSPPSAFVGRLGYPKVSFGPLLPLQRGETAIFDEPEMWRNLSFEEIVNFRMSMVRAKANVDINSASNPSGLLYDTQVSMLSRRPVYAEFSLRKVQTKSVYYIDDTSSPFGPSAGVERYRFGNASSDRTVENVYYDGDMKSTEAVIRLYESGLTVNSIQKIFSLGMVGLTKKRKLVPTRWSITAVDDIISKVMLDSIKTMPSIDLFHVFVNDMLGSRYVIMLLPGNFAYEWVEAWFPGTVWNAIGKDVSSIADHEGFSGRKTYALPGGCYYSVRLAAAEYLSKIRRQGIVIALREIYPGQLLPLGVWNVREAVRQAFETQPYLFDNFSDTLNFAVSKLRLGIDFWKRSSYLIKEMIEQKRIDNF